MTHHFPSLLQLARATSAAAVAAQPWVGRNDKNAADAACVDALRAQLGPLDFAARVVIGEGEKDEAPALYNGERLGQGSQVPLDMAVDPLEGTTFCAKAQANAFSVLALAEPGALFNPGPAFYMDKIVVGPDVRGLIDPEAPAGEIAKTIAKASDKAIGQTRIYVLDRPRNAHIIESLRAAGAQVSLHAGGDVLGGMMALLSEGQIDALMGIGGTPEGVITAVAARALGGDCFGRLSPQSEAEAKAVEQAELDTQRWLTLDDLVAGDACQFCLTGLTDGWLLRAPQDLGQSWLTDTLALDGRDGSLHRIESEYAKAVFS